MKPKIETIAMQVLQERKNLTKQRPQKMKEKTIPQRIATATRSNQSQPTVPKEPPGEKLPDWRANNQKQEDHPFKRKLQLVNMK